MREIKFETPSWECIHLLLMNLADKIRRNGFEPEAIIGVSRGGWVPARILSDLLGNSNLANVRVEFYTGIYEKQRKPRVTQPVSLPVKGKCILVVDDIVDTGKSLQLVCDMLSAEGGIVTTAVLYYKNYSILKPDYYCVETSSWIVFPWELYETVKDVGGKMLRNGTSVEDVTARLVDIGLNAYLVRRILKNIV